MRKQDLIRGIQTFVWVLLLCATAGLTAQPVIKGTVTDQKTGEPLMGASVLIVGKLAGTVTDIDGRFELEAVVDVPFQLRVSYIGYQSEEMTINTPSGALKFELQPASVITNEIVVSASRLNERILEAPVTIEAMGPIDIRQTAAPDFYDGSSNLKGVQTTKGSLTFTSINTRGFGAVANERFVQLIDGMDNAAPILNFPMGNIAGISDLDVARVELVPGAASALYGPNAFNGILIMESKNPFDYEGLSVETKGGLTSSAAGGSDPYYQVAARYAQAFGKHLAFKVNASYLMGTDWTANDYTGGRTTLANPKPSSFGSPDFDGLNTYGDETPIVVPMAFLAEPLSQALAPAVAAQFGIPEEMAQAMLALNIPRLPTLNIRRSGLKEEDLLDNQRASSLKLDAALHYRLTDQIEAKYQYRFGQGSTIYQGGDRFPLRGFTQQYHQLELKGSNFFARAYAALTDDGNSYNLTALGGYANEYFKESENWVGEYAAAYSSVLLPIYLGGGIPTETEIAKANAAGRQYADSDIPKAGSAEFNTIVEQVRKGLFQRVPPGAGFVDRSRMYHAEGNYQFKELKDLVELQIGGNFRRYDLFTDGTVLNEAHDDAGDHERINIDEYGLYVQAGKPLMDEHLKVTASVRYDKNENFKGQLSPRLSLLFSPDPDRRHNLRASFQTGFRNPSTQQQFIFFPQPDAYLLGSAEANAAPYGVHNGGAYTNSSYQAFLQSVVGGKPDPGLLQRVNVPYVQPEKLQVFELGYKGLIQQRLLVDLNAYYNRYNDFIAQQIVRAQKGTSQFGQYLPGVDDMLAGQASGATGFELFINAPETVTSFGSGLGLNYDVAKGFQVYGHYTYSTYDVEDPGPDFEARFNMPKHKFLFGLSNRMLMDKRMAFNVSYRWQDAFRWESSFGHADVPAYGVVDAQLSYTVKPLATTIKIGGSNIGGPDYRTHAGGPFIGSIYYVGLTFDSWGR